MPPLASVSWDGVGLDGVGWDWVAWGEVGWGGESFFSHCIQVLVFLSRRVKIEYALHFT